MMENQEISPSMKQPFQLHPLPHRASKRGHRRVIHVPYPDLGKRIASHHLPDLLLGSSLEERDGARHLRDLVRGFGLGGQRGTCENELAAVDVGLVVVEVVSEITHAEREGVGLIGDLD